MSLRRAGRPSGCAAIAARQFHDRITSMAVMPYRGHVRNGQIALDQPAALPEGAEVSVQLVETAGNSSTGQIDRRQILQMTVEQRRHLLTQQAERLAGFYASDQEKAEKVTSCAGQSR
jgi:hypothetical protein